MKSTIFTSIFLIFGFVAYAQLEIKGFKIGGKIEHEEFRDGIKTTILGQETTIRFFIEEDLQKRLMYSNVTINYFHFNLNKDNAKSLISALKGKYGGTISEDEKKIILISGQTEVYVVKNSLSSSWFIAVSKYSPTNTSDF